MIAARYGTLRIFVVLALAFVFAAAGMRNPACAGELTYFGAGGSFTLHLTSLKELKFRTVIQQKYDFSCGSAALATLLTYHYHHPVKEMSVALDMWKHGNRAKIKRLGFSMLDMKEYLARHGIPSNGYRSSLARLVKAAVPAIVLLRINGYLHFTIVEGIRDGRVLIADPALGTRAISVGAFKREWNGVVFVILNDVKAARATFNRASDWAIQPRAPVAAVRNVGAYLSSLLLSLPSPHTF
ncbi:MAG: C39 family peptidase [Stellaceae bacterium]